MSDGSTVTRRDFIRGTAYGSLGIAMGVHANRTASAAEGASTTVVVVRDEAAMDDSFTVNGPAVAAMLDQALTRLSGKENPLDAWRCYIKPDDIVGIKSNVFMVPTRKEVLAAIKARIGDVGVPAAKIFVGDRGKSPGKRPATQCTALLNVPGLKSHFMSGIGVAIKNYICYAPNARKLHADSCADLAQAFDAPAVKGKTRLTIVDALRPLFDKGPKVNPKYLWPYKALIVGTDPVAVDTVCLKIIQAKRDEFKGEKWEVSPPPKHIAIADTKYGLGTSDLSKIDIVKIGPERDFLI